MSLFYQKLPGDLKQQHMMVVKSAEVRPGEQASSTQAVV